MAVRLHNPYRDMSGRWVRGSFHGHCAERSGCASVPLAEGARMYDALGADFMTVTDHGSVTDLTLLREAHPHMVFLEGMEHSVRENLLFVGELVPALQRFSLEEAVALADGLLTIIPHPQPTPGQAYWSREDILSLCRLPHGIEVFNGHYGVPGMRMRGRTPHYAHVWDDLLTAGHRLWGFANDDFHHVEDLDNGFNMVLVEELTVQAVLAAAKSGCFYASTGLLLEQVEEHDRRITVTTASPCEGRFIGPGGAHLALAHGRHFQYTVTDEAYVRFEAEGDEGLLYLQPMFPETGTNT